eukprot:TRINITY_DN3559_c0_g1_i1.p1 TRINITY_DN3559_c0_g1~~TRINITY_DN3559_c0_g1_i1.p1  ORF type:complete len:314 (-),score=22.11 TRINITY_DN3559_c0_g1_i1:469-1410(-)
MGYETHQPIFFCHLFALASLSLPIFYLNIDILYRFFYQEQLQACDLTIGFFFKYFLYIFIYFYQGDYGCTQIFLTKNVTYRQVYFQQQEQMWTLPSKLLIIVLYVAHQGVSQDVQGVPQLEDNGVFLEVSFASVGIKVDDVRIGFAPVPEITTTNKDDGDAEETYDDLEEIANDFETFIWEFTLNGSIPSPMLPKLEDPPEDEMAAEEYDDIILIINSPQSGGQSEDISIPMPSLEVEIDTSPTAEFADQLVDLDSQKFQNQSIQQAPISEGTGNQFQNSTLVFSTIGYIQITQIVKSGDDLNKMFANILGIQ